MVREGKVGGGRKDESGARKVGGKEGRESGRKEEKNWRISLILGHQKYLTFGAICQKIACLFIVSVCVRHCMLLFVYMFAYVYMCFFFALKKMKIVPIYILSMF